MAGPVAVGLGAGIAEKEAQDEVHQAQHNGADEGG